jgi:septum site-determining protein MinC
MNDLISVKGSREGLRVQLDEAAEWSEVVDALRTHLEQSGSFFAGARLLVDIGEREIGEQQLSEMLGLMDERGIRPEALLATARESRNAARAVGLLARVISPPASTSPAPSHESEAMLVVRTVRSGQVVRHQGHITLIGDVNAGAEVIAGGSVVVWGRLRGLVHAGAMGDSSALICALELRPTQLRIANLIARTPEDTPAHGHIPLPEVARIADEHIIVEGWDLPRK